MRAATVYMSTCAVHPWSARACVKLAIWLLTLPGLLLLTIFVQPGKCGHQKPFLGVKAKTVMSKCSLAIQSGSWVNMLLRSQVKNEI